MNNKNDENDIGNDGFRSLILDGWWYEALFFGESDLSWSGYA